MSDTNEEETQSSKEPTNEESKTLFSGSSRDVKQQQQQQQHESFEHSLVLNSRNRPEVFRHLQLLTEQQLHIFTIVLQQVTVLKIWNARQTKLLKSILATDEKKTTADSLSGLSSTGRRHYRTQENTQGQSQKQDDILETDTNIADALVCQTAIKTLQREQESAKRIAKEISSLLLHLEEQKEILPSSSSSSSSSASASSSDTTIKTLQDRVLVLEQEKEHYELELVVTQKLRDQVEISDRTISIQKSGLQTFKETIQLLRPYITKTHYMSLAKKSGQTNMNEETAYIKFIEEKVASDKEQFEEAMILAQ
jgi:hypothetical protein